MEVASVVAELVGLITNIFQTVETVSVNKKECKELAGCLCTIRWVLAILPEDPEVRPPLEQLKNTLHQADEMIVACENCNAAQHFFRARHHADCFTQVYNRIMRDTSILNLLLSSLAARHRLRSNQILPPSPSQAGATRSATVPSPASSSGYQAVISHVSSIFDNPRIFTWAQIEDVTSNFTNKLDGGCSALVFKGRLDDAPEPEVAVKVLNSARGGDGKESAFMAEFHILVLLSLRHDHIVRLVGWCADEEDQHRAFVHEFMNKGTLRDHLQRRGGGSTSSSSPVTTSWRTRLQVLLGVSRAIHYLHHGAAPQPVIHRNVTSSNILLDASWNPRLSGFGSAVLLAAGEEQGGQLVGDGEFVGTFGYIDPEYKLTMKASPASDVYSFGVVILEALTGSPLAKKGKPLVDSALPAIQNNRNLRSALDKHLPSTPQQLKALELVADTASCCLRPYGNARPTMSAVVANFERALSFISA
ncbi:hypothetical protein ZWY2020_016977 [Hordeum vulgare]|nr:hypothetical protein ZWY2020_016977 [Hordeum vulgare]